VKEGPPNEVAVMVVVVVTVAMVMGSPNPRPKGNVGGRLAPLLLRLAQDGRWIWPYPHPMSHAG
jgi:hypothetical protein